MGLNLFIICLIVKVASLAFIAAAWRLYRPPRKQEHEMHAVESYSNGSRHQSNGSVSSSQNGGVVSPVFEPDEAVKKVPRKSSRQRDTNV